MTATSASAWSASLEELGLRVDVVAQHAEVVAVAEQVGELVRALGQPLHALGARDAEDLRRVPEILHALAPLVEVLGGRVLAGGAHALAPAAVDAPQAG